MGTLVYWITAVASLIAVWLNIHHRVAAFWIWAGTNAVWVHVDLRHGIYPQAALQGVYFFLSIYGIHKWSHSHGETRSRRV